VAVAEIAAKTRRHQRSIVFDNPRDMLTELADDNQTLAARLREAHNVCEEHHDVATASLIEVWIDETERRAWFLSEAKRGA
jgi:starvation-inducible DNA-binding protein